MSGLWGTGLTLLALCAVAGVVGFFLRPDGDKAASADASKVANSQLAKPKDLHQYGVTDDNG